MHGWPTFLSQASVIAKARLPGRSGRASEALKRGREGAGGGGWRELFCEGTDAACLAFTETEHQRSPLSPSLKLHIDFLGLLGCLHGKAGCVLFRLGESVLGGWAPEA